jgi:hypothetical protein
MLLRNPWPMLVRTDTHNGCAFHPEQNRIHATRLSASFDTASVMSIA